MLVVDAWARREVVVTLPEEIDVTNAACVAEQLTMAISDGSTVIIDMSATTFCDCAGARAIARAHQHATDSRAELRPVVTAELVRRIFGLAGINRLLDMYRTVEAARDKRGNPRTASRTANAVGITAAAEVGPEPPERTPDCGSPGH